MTVSQYPKTISHGSVTFIDGTTPTAVEHEGQFDNGNFEYDNLSADMTEVLDIIRRGVYLTSTKGDPEPITGSFDAIMTEFTDATDGTLACFALKQAPYAANISVLGDNDCVPYLIDIKWTVAGCGAEADHTITFHKCRVVVGGGEAKPSNAFRFRFECKGGVSGDWTLAAA